MFKGFKEFILRGNVIDLAIGVIIGAAFGKIISSLVNDILMPPLGMLLGKVDFSNLFIALNGKIYPSLAAAKAEGAATINFGIFINNAIDFLIIAFALFFTIKQINHFKDALTKKEEAQDKDCPYCCSKIPIKAVKCAHCGSEQPAS
jgi:large conductance mechanosensitive channel